MNWTLIDQWAPEGLGIMLAVLVLVLTLRWLARDAGWRVGEDD